MTMRASKASSPWTATELSPDVDARKPLGTWDLVPNCVAYLVHAPFARDSKAMHRMNVRESAKGDQP